MEDFELESIGIPKERIELFQEEIENHKNDSSFFVSLGEGLVQKKKFEEAKKCFVKALSIKNQDANAWNSLGAVHIELKNLTDASRCFERALSIDPNFFLAYFNLGLLYQKVSRFVEAANCFAKASSINPNHIGSHLGLANIYSIQEKTEKAAEHYSRVLELNPNHVSARYMLSAIQELRVEKAPEKYVTELFDSYSNNFDRHLQEKLEYQAPHIIAEEVEKLFTNKIFESFLDLGCGTGEVAVQLKGKFKKAIGIDLSTRMIETAKTKNVYRDLLKQDVLKYLEKSSESHDLIIAADMLPYLGDIKELVSLVEKRLVADGVFVITTELLSGSGFKLLPTGRFAHATEYIKSTSLPLECIFEKEIDLRKDRGKFLKGNILIFEKKTT